LVDSAYQVKQEDHYGEIADYDAIPDGPGFKQRRLIFIFASGFLFHSKIPLGDGLKAVNIYKSPLPKKPQAKNIRTCGLF